MTTSSPTLAAYAAEIAAIAAEGAKSAVGVETRGRASSGFYWKPDMIVTASEALSAKKDEAVKVRSPSGEVFEGRVAGRDPSTDVAVIQTSSLGEPMPMRTQPIGLGEAVVAVGRSRHGPFCAAGVVALAGPAWRSMRGGEISQRVRLDLKLMAHSEGGPVLDASGAGMGMAVFGPRRSVLVIPPETIERAANEIAAHGRVRRGYLGVGVQSVPIQASGDKAGLMVVSLDDKGPARQGGVLQGDIILSIDGETVSSPRSLARALTGSRIGTASAVALVRAGEQKTLTVTIGETR